MKTITIDYELYLKELNDAKLDGFNQNKELLPKLITISNALNSYDKDNYDKGLYDLKILIYKLNK